MSRDLPPPSIDTYYKLDPHGNVVAINMLTGEHTTLMSPLTTPIAQYSVQLGNAICDLIREGKTYKHIASKLNIPAQAIYHWRHLHPDFGEKCKAARQDRAEYFHNKMVEIAEGLEDNTDEDTLKNEKTRFDMFNRLAGIDAPTTYGSKTVISGDAEAPITIKLETGIRRAPPQAPTVSHADLAREAEQIIEATAIPLPIPEASSQPDLPLGHLSDPDLE